MQKLNKRPADILEAIFKANPEKIFSKKDFNYMYVDGNIYTALKVLIGRKIINYINSDGGERHYIFNKNQEADE